MYKYVEQMRKREGNREVFIPSQHHSLSPQDCRNMYTQKARIKIESAGSLGSTMVRCLCVQEYTGMKIGVRKRKKRGITSS